MANKIVYEDYAVGASDKAYCYLYETDYQTGNGRLSSLFDNTAKEFVSFDDGGIDLNQDVCLYTTDDSTYANAGFVSSTISDISGKFTTPPRLTIRFEYDQPFSGNGITLFFAEHYCKSVKVEYFNGSTSLATYQKDDISSKEVYLPTNVTNYTKIKITFLETETPNQYAKVYKVEFGHKTVIEKFRSISFNKKMDFYGSDISIGTLDVQFLSDIEMNFCENQKLRLYHNNVLIGTYWVAESERQTDKLYSVTAEDVFSRFDDKEISNVFCSDDSESGLLLSDISSSLSSVATITIYGDTEKEVKGYFEAGSCRRLLAEAITAFEKYLKVNSDGTIVLFDPVMTLPKTIPQDQIIGTADFKQIKAPTTVEITIDKYTYPWRVKAGNKASVSGVTITQSGLDVTTKEPSVSIEVYNSRGEKIPQRPENTNLAYTITRHDDYNFTITATGYYDSYLVDVEIFGCPYESNDETIKTSRNIMYTEAQSTKAIGKRCFYRTDTSAWISSIASRAFSVVGEVRAKIITEDIDVGDYVSIETKYSGTKYGTVTEINADVGQNDIVKDVVITVWQ